MKMHLSALGLLAAVALLGATAAASPSRAGVAAIHAGAEPYTGTIAFLRGPPDASTISQSLYVVRPDGSGVRRLTPPELPVYKYAWSPDGSQIAFIDADHGSLWLVHPDGTGLRQLLSGSKQASVDLSWSPGGKSIAIASLGPNARATTCGGLPIYIVPIDGTQPTAVPGARAGCSVAWSPRGSEIAYEGSGGIWVIHPDGSGRRQVSPIGWGWVRWSADGKQLAFGVAIMKHGLVIGRYHGIGDVDANGRHRRLVTRHADNEYPAAWSPHRRRILYGRAELGGIYVISADGRNDFRVTSDSPLGSLWPALAWSPDGGSIVYATDQTGNGDLYIAGANGRGKVQLTNTADWDNSPSWVANALAATTARPATQAPALLPADAGIVTHLAFDPTHPDTVYAGTLVAVNGKGPGPGRVYKSTDSGNHWRLISRPGWPRISALAVDPERPRTLYVGTGKDLYKTTNGGRTWHAWKRGLLPPPGINRGEGWTDWLAVDPINSKTVYEHDYAETLRKSTDGGHTWKVMLSLWQKGGMSGLLMGPGRPPALYAAFSSPARNGVYKSTNGAKTWRKLGLPPFGPNDRGAASAADPQQNAIYMAVGARIFASTNAGQDWRLISQGLALTPDHYVTSLAAGGGTVFATFWGTEAIYKSADGGGTWTQSWPASKPTPGLVGDIVAVDPARPTTVYAVSYNTDGSQILRSINSGRTWTVVG